MAKYRVIGGSVVYTDEHGQTDTMLGIHCKEGDGLPPDTYPIGVDSTDPGLASLTNQWQWTRGIFPGRPDLLFAAGDKVVWVEAKTNWSDFDSSRRSKRLAREVRTGQDMADIVVLAYPANIQQSWTMTCDADKENQFELLRLQTQGVLVVPWIASFTYWDGIRNVLGSSSNQRRVIAGTDYRKPRTALAGLPGVGAKTEAKLLACYGNADNALARYESWNLVLGDKQAQRIRTRCLGQVLGV